MRPVLLLLALLAACAPAVRPPSPQETFEVRGETLEVTMAAPILHLEAGVEGPVTSRYCEGGVTVQPALCPVRSDGYTRLYVPEGPEYARVVALGTVDKPPGFAAAFVSTADGRESVRLELSQSAGRP